MKDDFFYTKVHLEFAIRSEDEDVTVITKSLRIEPNRFFNKGDTIEVNGILRNGKRPHGIWAIAKSFTSADPNINEHIESFNKILSNKKSELESLKREYGFEFIFQISATTEDAGFGFDLNKSELRFLSEIVDRFTCFFNVVEELADKENVSA